MHKPSSSSAQSDLEIVNRPIDELKPDLRNARLHSRRQVEQLANSFQEFRVIQPVIVNEDLDVVCGHGRLEAAKLLGINSIPTISITHLTPAQQRAFAIADNKLTENATWDEPLLAEHFRELSELNLDFNLDLTGFSVSEIDVLIENLDPEGPSDTSDDLPIIAEAAVCRAGDSWLLGKHRVLCGNALVADDYERLMGHDIAAMIIADPPYNVPILGNVSGKGVVKHEDFAMACGEMSPEEFTQFLRTALQLTANKSRSGAIAFVAMDWRHIGELLDAGRKVFSGWKNLAVWKKDRPGMGTFYRSQHELFFIFKHGSDPHINNFELGQFGRYRTNVWEYPSAVSFAQSSDEGNLLRLHPTVKPVALVADCLKDCSRRNDIILDPFLGSGTTVIAAEKTGRVCFGLEIEPKYVDVIVRRWQNFTSLHATHATTGRLFNDLEAEVLNGR